MSSAPFSGLRADRRIGIGKQLFYYWVGHIHSREDASSAKSTGPEPALTQLPSAVEQRNLARDESQALLSRPGHVARRLQERSDLCIAGYPPERIDFLYVDGATR